HAWAEVEVQLEHPAGQRLAPSKRGTLHAGAGNDVVAAGSHRSGETERADGAGRGRGPGVGRAVAASGGRACSVEEQHAEPAGRAEAHERGAWASTPVPSSR